MKKLLQPGVTYIICPDRSCRLFYDTMQSCPCDGRCPKQKEERLVIVCSGCNETIVLPGGSHVFVRTDHLCANGHRTPNFRMSGVYELLYEIPKNQP